MRTRGSKNSTSYCRFFTVCFLASILVSGCAAKLPPVKTYEEAAREVAARGPLVSPPIEQREGYEDGTSVTIDKDQPAPFKGILLDATKVTKHVAIKAERDRRRAELEAITKKAEIQKIIYESAIERLRAIAESRKSWWDNNKGIVGLVIGTTVGMAIVVGIMYAITGGKSLQTTITNLTVQRVP